MVCTQVCCSGAALADRLRTLAPHIVASDPWLLEGRAGSSRGSTVAHSWPADAAGWSDAAAFLRGLSPAALAECERHGLHNCLHLWHGMPRPLLEVCSAVRSTAMALGQHAAASGGTPEADEDDGAPAAGSNASSSRRQQRAEKTAQVTALVRLVSRHLRLEHVRRVVDVGCGKGHLIAELQRALKVPALGLERDEALVECARALYPTVGFASCDVGAGGGDLVALLREGDLLLGLHPCGALGEALVAAAAAHGGVALLMVPCCLHKQGRAARAACSRLGEQLGLGELAVVALKKASMARDATPTVEARRNRHALRRLLEARGVAAADGPRAEMSGLHPKKARRGLEALAADALAWRGLPPPAAGELERVAREAGAAFEATRRESVLEGVLGDLLELAVVLDRAAALHEVGLRTAALTAFPMHASDRNLAIVAAPARLASPSLAAAAAAADAAAAAAATVVVDADADADADGAATVPAEGGGAELVSGARARLCVTPDAGLRLQVELVCRAAAAAADGGSDTRDAAAWEEARCRPCV